MAAPGANFLAAQEAQKRRQESEKNRPAASTNGEAPPPAPRAPRMTKAGGWLPSSDSLHTRGELEDPLLQQIDNIQSFLRQARAARRTDEVAMLEENLRQLQDEYDQQQTSLAIALSQRLAREESLQQEELRRLEDREREVRAQAPGSSLPTHIYTWKSSLDFSQPEGQGDVEEEGGDGDLTPKAERSPPSVRSFPALTDQEEESPPRLRRLGGRVTPPGSDGQNSAAAAALNPFEEEEEENSTPVEDPSNPFEEDSTPVEEDPSNPFFEELQQEHREVSNGKKEYNPFEEEGEEGGVEGQGQSEDAPGNPFEEEEDSDAGNPFTEEASGGSSPPGASNNPFEDEDDDDEGALPDVDVIEEELLLQQIDNIRAYIFDAKLSGRLDEVELLSENLRELQRTLQEQKRKTTH